LINAFYEKTKVPILFNTSFNLAGDPLVETIEDALNTILNSDIKYLYLPDIKKLIVKD
jgi:carbamoyltransferase